MTGVLAVVGDVCAILALAGIAYTLIATAIVRVPRVARSPGAEMRPVSILKPLHFDEPGLEGNLASFLDQDYPGPVQMVFGVQSERDPAILVTQRLRATHPAADTALVIDAKTHGLNRKVSNLINMLPAAKHELLIVSDSDIRVMPDYLRGISNALAAPGVGAVTALYIGQGTGPVWSRLTAMGISYQFLPNVLVGVATGLARPCFGSTIALARDTLARTGGFQAFSDKLADDYEVGDAVRRLGLRVSLAPFAVVHACSEASFGALAAQDLRWARTIKAVDPAGHAGSLITFPVAWALAAFAAIPSPATVGLTALAILARGILKLQIDRTFAAHSGPLWLLPVRDVISFGIFLASFLGRRVEWRGAGFRVAGDGALSESTGE